MNLKDFWRARFARIYHAYVFSLLVTAPFFFLCGSDPKYSVLRVGQISFEAGISPCRESSAGMGATGGP